MFIIEAMHKVQSNSSRTLRQRARALLSVHEPNKLTRYQQACTLVLSPIRSVSLFSYLHSFDIIILLTNLISMLIIFRCMDFS
jgi:hypothetical protein